MRTIETDCLVIGAGLAGSAYALHMARAGHRVALLDLAGPTAANSLWAQGGVIYDTDPDPGQLAEDIISASDGSAWQPAVEQLVRDGPAAVRELLIDELQVGFDRGPDGELDLAREGGHSSRRIIHAKDATGHAILSALSARVDATAGIERHSGHVAIDLLTLSHSSTEPRDRYLPLTCFGCYALDTATGGVVAFVARRTVLATGGLGGIYQHSTNQPGSVGHGVAMAWRVGARLIDLEYVQFHPTAFYRPGQRPFLVTEALRGEGAVLVDSRGQRFMDAIDPRGSLAPRDVVARGIRQHLAESGEPCAWLDLSALDPAYVRERFPGVHQRCLGAGVDIAKRPIPVVPAAHFSCGGIHTDLAGQTTVRGLSAIGEVACTGLHGANRLASTSLLECLVAARATARAHAQGLATAPPDPLPTPRRWTSPSRDADPVLVRQDLQQVQITMWNYSGIIRSPRRLQRARRILVELREDVLAFYRDCRPTRELIELRSAVQTALLVVHAASLNPESRGCHYLSADD